MKLIGEVTESTERRVHHLGDDGNYTCGAPTLWEPSGGTEAHPDHVGEKDGWSYDWKIVNCEDCLAAGVEKSLMPIPFQMTREVGESDEAFRRRCKTMATFAQDLLEAGEGHVSIEVVGEDDTIALEELTKSLIEEGSVDLPEDEKERRQAMQESARRGWPRR